MSNKVKIFYLNGGWNPRQGAAYRDLFVSTECICHLILHYNNCKKMSIIFVLQYYVKFLIVAMLLTVTQTPSLVPRTAANSPASSSRKIKSNPNGNKESSSPSPSIPLDLNNTKTHDKQGEGIGPENQQNSIRIRELPPVFVESVKKDWADWGIWIFNGLLVVVGFLQWCVLRSHARHLDNLATEAKNNANAAVANSQAAMKQAEAVMKQVELMGGQLKVMQEQALHSVNTERAWILAEIGEIPSEPLQEDQLGMVWVRPSFRNHGNTVAKINKIRSLIRILEQGEVLPPKPAYPVGQGADIQAMNVLLPPNISIQPIKLGVTGDEFVNVRAGNNFMYLHGFIEYMDLSNMLRRTAFCFYYAVQLGFSPDPTRFYLELTAPSEYNECI